MKFIIIICVLYIQLQSIQDINYSPEHILKKHNIDLDLKSYNGWIRLLNSDIKLKQHGYTLNEYEKEILKHYIINLKKLRSRNLR